MKIVLVAFWNTPDWRVVFQARRIDGYLEQFDGTWRTWAQPKPSSHIIPHAARDPSEASNPCRSNSLRNHWRMSRGAAIQRRKVFAARRHKANRFLISPAS
jgi:hypothetical protein